MPKWDRGIGDMCKEVRDFIKWLKDVITSYRKNITPDEVRDILERIRALLEKHTRIVDALSDIVSILRTAFCILNICFTVAALYNVYCLTLHIGDSFQSHFNVPMSMMPDLCDTLVATGTTLAMWIPGLSGWGAAAGTVLATTPAGAIAAVPLLVGVTAYAGWHFGRRKLANRQTPAVTT